MITDFRKRIRQGPLLCDGAMGTMLDMYEYNKLPHDLQNLKNPDIVERIHTEYIDAGAELIETNTFSANRFRLKEYHLEDRLEEINRRGVEIARRAAGDRIYVAGAVGPTGKLLEPIGKVTLKGARDAFKEQIEVLVRAGVDLLMLETFVSLNELDEAIDAAHEVSDCPVIAQKAFPEDGSILSGSFPIEVVEHLLSKGVDIIGANCTVGPQRMFSIIRSMYKDGVVLSAQPAAGIPTLMNGRAVYHTGPEYLATYARELVQAGVSLIGACCGSTPSHIRAMRAVLDALQQEQPRITLPAPGIQLSGSSVNVQMEADRSVLPRRKEHSRFSQAIGKRFVTSVELDIPRGVDMSSVLEGARYLHRSGIDAINITDGARARLRMSPIAISTLVQQQVGIETMTHLTTRDRNLIGLQAELLGAHALGIRNILCVTGDPAKVGDFPHATSVFDIDSIGLIRAIHAMNEGKDLMGNTIESETAFTIACAANPTADNMESEVERLEKKIAAGANIIYTQPIYELNTLELFLRRIEQWRIPVMVGILPLRSYRHAEFLHHEIPGMNIPDSIREALRSAGPAAGVKGVELARQFLHEARTAIAGAYLMPPFKKYEIVPKILGQQ